MKRLLSIISVIGLLLATAGCSSAGSDGDSGPEAPDMGSASDLPDTGATAPATEDVALAIYEDSLTAFSEEMDSLMSITPSLPIKERLALRIKQDVRARAARYTDEDSESLDWSGSVGGGTVTMKGTYSWKETGPDTYKFNAWNKMTLWEHTTRTTTVSNVAVDDISNSFTMVKGTEKQDVEVDVTSEYFLDSEGDLADFKVSISFSLAYGIAASIVRDDGVGAKYILSIAAEGDQDDINSGTAKLTIYDDSDTVLYNIDIPLDEFISVDEED